MGLLDSLTWHIMDAMAEDWETIELIQPHVRLYCASFPDERVAAVIRELHAEGLVEIMESGGDTNAVFPDDPRRTWFSITPSGRALWDAAGVYYRDEEEPA